ncbi:hypothetical protein V493_05780 [Pseudogymnoascus sp. VKM F-4281 (FW-2241)]|nr:hypothetical protein V493_05780 [Pseudogymnoascus sp. VKM F-4281 (FW-2241)]
MAISDSIQTLSAAFSFGILLQTAVSSFVIYLSGHGSTIFQDRRRLVLITFILSSALWAQIGFLNFLIPARNSNLCQGTIATSTFFDQAARTLSGAFLLWTVAHVSKSSAEKYGLGSLIGARTVSGIVFVVFTRPQFAPLCVPRSAALPVSILIIGLDAIILGLVAIRIFTLGFWGSSNGIQSTSNKEHGRALALFTAGFAIWTGTSVTLHLGLGSIILLLRTAIPAAGLGILLIIATIWSEALLSSREAEAGTPESQSPFIAPPRPRFNSTSTSDGSPTSGARMSTNGRLFVVNPSSTPGDSPQLQSYRDDRQQTNFGNIMVNTRTVDIATRGISADAPTEGNMLGTSTTIIGGITTTVTAPPPLIPSIQRSRPIWDGEDPETKQKRSFFSRSKQPTQSSSRKFAISQPILTNADESSGVPFPRMQTVDLVTAAANERARRQELATRRSLVATRPAPAPPTGLDPSDALKRSTSTVRKKPSGKYQDLNYQASQSSVSSNGSSSSSNLSPGLKDVRKRSPRQLNGFDIDEKRQYYNPAIANPLPPNPKMKQFQPTPEKRQTIMFMKDIVYDDPGLVDSIISEVPNFSKKPKAPVDRSKSVGVAAKPSILHRARPYKKTRDSEGVFFPSEPSPNHRRSRSSSSVLRAPIIGNSTSLPPLPAPPADLAQMRGLLKDHIHNMTNDEKVSMLFPMPPVGAFRTQRRSSVPSLPSSVSTADAPDPISKDEIASRRSSRRSTIISILPVEKQGNLSPRKHTRKLIQRDTYRSKLNANVPDIGNDVVPIRKSNIPPQKMHSSFTETIDSSNDGNGVRDSEWLHQPLPALPKSYTTNRDSSTSTADSLLKDHKFMSIMMGYDPTEVPATRAGPTSFLHDSSQTFGTEAIKTPTIHTWHTRIGDEIPAFSKRRNHSLCKSVPPPPLTLRTAKRKLSLSQKPLPAVVIDTPNRALQEIQAQLKQLEEPDLLPFIRDRSSSLGDPTQDQRDDLLAEMEKEVGEQENRWQQLHDNIDRDSKGSEDFTPWTTRRNSVASVASITSVNTASIKEARKARVRSIVEVAQNSVTVVGTRNGEIAKPGLWKDKLEDAHKSYASNAPSFLNSLSTAKVVTAKQASIRAVVAGGCNVVAIPSSNQGSRPAQLWKPCSPKTVELAGLLWTPPQQRIQVRPCSPEPAALFVRPAQRRTIEPLRLQSLHMWCMPTPTRARPTPGLWRSKNTRPASIITRPKTQKPARKSRPVTFLPDIVESPSPLPHKRDTLGIFQFPWGEKSDQAVYQPALPAISNLPRLMIPNILGSNDFNDEYSSSFFDDYDDQDYQSDSASLDGDSPSDEASDDGFDDSTLWEIANLLDSSEVPSRHSLLPQIRIIEDYDDSDDEVAPASRAPVIRFMPIMPLSPNPKSPGPKSPMDSDPEALALTPLAGTEMQWPIPPIPEPEAFVTDIVPNDRSAWWDGKSHLPRGPRDTVAFKERHALKASASKATSYLWTPPKAKVVAVSSGLFTLGASEDVRDVPTQEPAAISMFSKPRPNTAPLPTISSTKLWSDSRRVSDFTFDWISESTVRARSPSIGTSSGNTSPGMATESDEYSVKTFSTKASSLQSDRGAIAMEVPFMLVEAVPVKQTKKTTPRSRARHAATPAEWDAALEDAIKASAIPAKKLGATKEMWTLALEEALEASAQVPVKPAQSPSKKSLWSTAISFIRPSEKPSPLWSVQKSQSASKVASITPAANPAFKRPLVKISLELPKLDSTSLWSVRQPVAATATVRSWLHEASPVSEAQLVVTQSLPIMWTPPAQSPSRPTSSSSSKELWQPRGPQREQQNPNMVMSITPTISPAFRKPSAKISTELPKLNSTSLWSATEPVAATATVRNWLHESVTESPVQPAVVPQVLNTGLWTPPAPAPPKPVSTSKGLWEPSTRNPTPRPAPTGLFEEPISSPSPATGRKTKPAGEVEVLPPLGSSQLWSLGRATMPKGSEERDWIRETRSTKVNFRY